MISNNRLLLPVLRNILQRRNQSVVSGPPAKHVSRAEKRILGSIMVASLLVVPTWVLAHIKEYKAPK